MKKNIYFTIIAIIIILILSAFLNNNGKIEKIQNKIETIDIKIGEKVYTHSKSIYAYGKSGIKIYNNKNVVLEDSFNLENPYISSSYNHVAIGDKNGRVVRVYSNNAHLYTVNTATNILGFSVNKQGFLAIILDNESFYNIELYNPSGDNIFSVKEITYEEGVPVSVSISDDGKVLAVSHIKTSGATISSKVSFHSVELGKIFGGVNKDGSFVSIVKFLDNNRLVGISDKEIFNIDVDSVKNPPKVVQTNSTQIKNIIKNIKFMDGFGYAVYFGTPTTYKDANIQKNFVNIYNTIGREVSSYMLNDKEVSNIWGDKNGIIILENRLFTAIDTNGTELWSYKPTQDVKSVLFYGNPNNAIIITNNQIKIMQMDKGVNKIAPANIERTEDTTSIDEENKNSESTKDLTKVNEDNKDSENMKDMTKIDKENKNSGSIEETTEIDENIENTQETTIEDITQTTQ